MIRVRLALALAVALVSTVPAFAGAEEPERLHLRLNYSMRNGAACGCGIATGMILGPVAGASTIAAGINVLDSMDQIMKWAQEGTEPKTTGELVSRLMTTPLTAAAARMPISTWYHAIVDVTLVYDEAREKYVVEKGTLSWDTGVRTRFEEGGHLLVDELNGGNRVELERGSEQVALDFGDEMLAQYLDPAGEGGETTYGLKLDLKHPVLVTGTTAWVVQGGQIWKLHQHMKETGSTLRGSAVGQSFPTERGEPCTYDQGIGYEASERRITDRRASFAETWTDPTGSQHAISWNLTFPIEVEIEPVAQAWLPEGPPEARAGTPDAAGNSVTVKARITSPRGMKANWIFEVSDVTGSPGVAMNGPGGDSKPDFRIDPAKNPKLALSKTLRGTKMEAVTRAPANEAELTLTSMDYAAWARVRAFATINGVRFPAKMKGDPARGHVTVPRDGAGGVENRIADAWEKEHRVAGVDGDADADGEPVADGHPGDGLTAWEEYRGFFARKRMQPGSGKLSPVRHLRTDPSRKELFVAAESDDFLPGLSFFGRASGIPAHVVAPAQCGPDEEMNANRGTRGIGRQRAVRMAYEKLGEESGQYVLGKAPRRGHKSNDFLLPRSPGDADGVYLNAAFADGTLPQEMKGSLDRTVAHELAHALHVDHHGTGDYLIESGSLEMTAYGKDGSPSRHPLGGLSGLVAVRGGSHSGDEECLMHYSYATLYEDPCGPVSGSFTRGGKNLDELANARKSLLGPGGNAASKKDGPAVKMRFSIYAPKTKPASRFCGTGKGTGGNDGTERGEKYFCTAAPIAAGKFVVQRIDQAGDAATNRGSCALRFHVCDTHLPTATTPERPEPKPCAIDPDQRKFDWSLCE